MTDGELIRVARRPLTHDEVMVRIGLGLSPSDDGLPLAQAERQKAVVAQAAHAFSQRQKKRSDRDPA